MIKVSIVICAYNREKYILDALNSIARQTLDYSKFELIIVDNNCTDNTPDVCKTFHADHPEMNYKYVIETNQGLPYSRNRGIKEATGEIVTFIDDDAIAEPEFVENILKAFETHPEFTAVGGKILPIYPGKKEPVWMSKYIQGIATKVDWGNTVHEFNRQKYPAGCNMSFRKDVFNELGGFSTTIVYRGDDKYIFSKLRDYKKRILYAPDIVVHHNVDAYRLTPQFITKQSIEIGQSEQLRLMNASPGIKFKKIFEYIYKLIAAFALAFIFILKGQLPKAIYIIKIRWHVLRGYFIKKK